jgi:hypothetical protein
MEEEERHKSTETPRITPSMPPAVLVKESEMLHSLPGIDRCAISMMAGSARTTVIAIAARPDAMTTAVPSGRNSMRFSRPPPIPPPARSGSFKTWAT